LEEQDDLVFDLAWFFYLAEGPLCSPLLEIARVVRLVVERHSGNSRSEPLRDFHPICSAILHEILG
jgi:hypothetical protein